MHKSNYAWDVTVYIKAAGMRQYLLWVEDMSNALIKTVVSLGTRNFAGYIGKRMFKM